MAFSVLTLLVTGFRIHLGPGLPFTSLSTAVRAHNLSAALLTVNAFLSLFYHLASAAIRHFVPSRAGWERAVREQAHYYLFGIFRGHARPEQRTPEKKLNVLQQVTYLGLLNVLFPWQVVSGALIWAIGERPEWAAALGGLTFIAPLHNLGAWLFLAFSIGHVYLTTTGPRWSSHITAMVDGHDEVEDAPGDVGDSMVREEA